jgi:hypothetical protein
MLLMLLLLQKEITNTLTSFAGAAALPAAADAGSCTVLTSASTIESQSTTRFKRLEHMVCIWIQL